jgi:hypothetical protein
VKKKTYKRFWGISQQVASVPSAPLDGSILDGSLPNTKRKLVEAWIEIHRDDLLADWQLAVEGATVFKIKGLE